MLQLTEAQEAALCKLRRDYIMNTSHVAKQQHQLQQRLQHLPSVKLNTAHLAASQEAQRQILLELDSCLIQDNALWLKFLQDVGHGVRACTQMLSLSLATFVTDGTAVFQLVCKNAATTLLIDLPGVHTCCPDATTSCSQLCFLAAAAKPGNWQHIAGSHML